MKIKTSELTDEALNWAVASIEWPNDIGIRTPEFIDKQFINEEYKFDTDWSMTGLIMATLFADYQFGFEDGEYFAGNPGNYHYSKSILIATLRCYVDSKLGDEVEVPDHLL